MKMECRSLVAQGDLHACDRTDNFNLRRQICPAHFEKRAKDRATKSNLIYERVRDAIKAADGSICRSVR